MITLALLLTCSRMSEHDLCSDSIYGVAGSLQGLSISKPETTLLVRYRGDVVWSIPAAECQTWFVRSPVPGIFNFCSMPLVD